MTFANDAAQEILGRPAGDIVGTPIAGIFPELGARLRDATSATPNAAAHAIAGAPRMTICSIAPATSSSVFKVR